MLIDMTTHWEKIARKIQEHFVFSPEIFPFFLSKWANNTKFSHDFPSAYDVFRITTKITNTDCERTKMKVK